ncbi:MAG: hypothetical protein EPN92_09310 [Chitinophagaceae bacterium]|nr:MAG: hypothetical protein EPN92_09310 [Chitinophagaceae bacterium]
MKKYLLGLTALALAIGLSAFDKEKKLRSTDPQPYYWYEVQGDVTVSEVLNSGGTIDIGEAMSLVGECDELEGDICLAGFEDDDVPLTTAAPSPSAEEDNLLFKP